MITLSNLKVIKNNVAILIYYLYNRNYKYRRLSSTEKGSGICYSSGDEDEEIFSQGTEVIKLNCRSSSVSKSFTGDSPSKSAPDYEQLVDRPIKHGETLTGLALKYRIPVNIQFQYCCHIISGK